MKANYPGLKSLGALLFRLILSLIFLYTAIAKVRPIEPFEFTLVESGLMGWGVAGWLARGILGLEFAFSLLLLLIPNWRIIRNSISIFLGILSIYLIALLITKGNVADCGCMGAAHEISPLLSLIKNAGMILILLLIGKLGVGPQFKFYPRITNGTSLAIGLVIPFILEPLYGANGKGEKIEDFPKEALQNIEKLPEDFLKAESKYILAFMSTKCHWCQLAGRKMGIIDRRTDRELPYHFFFYGDEESEKAFWEETDAGPYPSTRLSLEKLMKFADGRVPVLILVKNGEAKWRLGFQDIKEKRLLEFLEDKKEKGS